MIGGVWISASQPQPLTAPVKGTQLAVSEGQSRFFRLAVGGSIRWPLILLGFMAALAGCARLYGDGMGRDRSGSVGDRPFGGVPAIDLPPSALAMGAYLKA